MKDTSPRQKILDNVEQSSKKCNPAYLLILFKQSLDSGVIDPSFKKAAIVPVFKSGDRTVPSNYRPISPTSVIIKVFERVIRKQIVTFLISNGHLNPTHHGFRGGHSCLSALMMSCNY